MPALPLDEAGKYVAAAYVVFVLLLVVYIGIMAAKLSRISREIEEVAELAEKRAAPPQDAARETGAPVSAGRESS
jgi:hypothetical protein